MDISGLKGLMTTNAENSAAGASANKVTNSLKNISADSSEEELKGIIKDFESYFVEQILKEMKDTFTGVNGEDKSTASQYKDLFMDTAVEQMADVIVDEVGENVTQQLYEQMRRNYNIPEETSEKSKV